MPKKWTAQKGLKPGDEIEVTEHDGNLLVSVKGLREGRKSINLSIEQASEAAIRTIIVNAYRAGFDVISLTCTTDEKLVEAIVDKNLLGVEVFAKGKNTYSIESVSEPSYDNFENIIKRQFYLIQRILENINDPDLEEYITKVQKNDNFLKRCMSKDILSDKAKPFLWQLLSNMTHVARHFVHVKEDMRRYKIKVDKTAQQVIEELKNILETLRKAYFTKNMESLEQLHKQGRNLVYNQAKSLFKKGNPVLINHLLIVAKMLYLLNSPLAGMLQIQYLEEKTKVE